MTQPESLEQTGEYARSALGSMGRHAIPQNPRNFAVWYAFHSGSNAKLARAIGILVSNAQPFTEAVNEELFDRFIGGKEYEAIRDTSRRVKATLGEVLGHLGEVGAGASQYGAALRDISGQVASETASALPRLIAELLDETRTIERQSELLGHRLASAAGTIEDLRRDLDTVQREAMTDTLTGVANRKGFELSLKEVAKQGMETGEELCLLIIDIDHFKRFNDTWGHQTGDEVLRLVAKTISKTIASGDIVARYGGEEFAVILPKADIATAVGIGNRIRSAFEARKLVKRGGGEIGNITVSIGAARFDAGEPLSNLVRRADTALYASKRDGRNRVTSAQELHRLAQTAPELT